MRCMWLLPLLLGFAGAVSDSTDCRQEPCWNGGVCSSVISAGSLECACPQGFVGRRCELRDPCLHSPCHPASHCLVNTSSWGHVCICPPGFVGDTCSIDLNECLAEPCFNGGRCINTEGGYRCNCTERYGGRHCELPSALSITLVDTMPTSDCRLGGVGCDNRGVCGSGDGICRCNEGFTGSRCEMALRPATSDPCSAQPCLNGGLCRSFAATGTFTCHCPASWIGLRCEQLLNPCTVSSCLGRGRCLPAVDGGFTCRCHRGFRGQFCEKLSTPVELPGRQTDLCDPNDSGREPWCLNGGRCFRLVGAEHPVCQCPRGFGGTRCQSDLNECEQFAADTAGPACLNGGTCVDEHAGFRCLCQPGFQGPYCQGDTGECANNLGPCSPAGTLRCTRLGSPDSLRSFTCVCKPGFVGPLCRQRVDPCHSIVCLNGGRCQLDPADSTVPVCLCPSGRSGQRCQFVGTACASSPCHGVASTCREAPLGFGFRCHCQPGLCGPTCAERCPTFAETRARCRDAGCDSLAGDGRCDLRCSGPACDWDGGDCVGLGARPWVNCSAMRLGLAACDAVYADGECNSVCNTEACLFDGGDCRTQLATAKTAGKVVDQVKVDPCPYRYCADHFADGSCDRGCDSPACLLDGGDCAEHRISPSQSPLRSTVQLASSSSSSTSAAASSSHASSKASSMKEPESDEVLELLELEVAASPSAAADAARPLARRLSRSLGTLVRLVHPPVASRPSETDASLVTFRLDACLDTSASASSGGRSLGGRDSPNCCCYRSAHYAAQAVAADVMSSRLLLPVRLRRVASVRTSGSRSNSNDNTGVASGDEGGGNGGGVVGVSHAGSVGSFLLPAAVGASCLLVLGLLLGFLLSAVRRNGGSSDGSGGGGGANGGDTRLRSDDDGILRSRCRLRTRWHLSNGAATAPQTLASSPTACGTTYADSDSTVLVGGSLGGSPLPMHSRQYHSVQLGHQLPVQLPVPRLAYRAQRLAMGRTASSVGSLSIHLAPEVDADLQTTASPSSAAAAATAAAAAAAAPVEGASGEALPDEAAQSGDARWWKRPKNRQRWFNSLEHRRSVSLIQQHLQQQQQQQHLQQRQQQQLHLQQPQQQQLWQWKQDAVSLAGSAV